MLAILKRLFQTIHKFIGNITKMKISSSFFVILPLIGEHCQHGLTLYHRWTKYIIIFNSSRENYISPRIFQLDMWNYKDALLQTKNLGIFNQNIAKKYLFQIVVSFEYF